ncbi:hypothetical protein KJ632_03335, partial [Patescibacteria group bacterium]|nr:hypothetical protein [Patescibacteria group bacterium]
MAHQITFRITENKKQPYTHWEIENDGQKRRVRVDFVETSVNTRKDCFGVRGSTLNEIKALLGPKIKELPPAFINEVLISTGNGQQAGAKGPYRTGPTLIEEETIIGLNPKKLCRFLDNKVNLESLQKAGLELRTGEPFDSYYVYRAIVGRLANDEVRADIFRSKYDKKTKKVK